MSYNLHPNLTPKRKAWLRLLLKGPNSQRANGRVGCDCLRLGWVDQHYELIGPSVYTLTDEGRKVLKSSRKAGAAERKGVA